MGEHCGGTRTLGCWALLSPSPSTTAPTTSIFEMNDMIQFIASHGLIGLSSTALLSLRCCLGPSAPSPLLALHRLDVVPRASTLPFTLATSPSQPSIHLDLLHLAISDYAMSHITKLLHLH